MHDTTANFDSEAGRMNDERSDRMPTVSESGGAEGSAADSFEKETRSQLHFLRERTFNRELRQLVDRLRENEPDAGDPGPGMEDIASLSDEELQLRLGRLYYLARNIPDNREINIY